MTSITNQGTVQFRFFRPGARWVAIAGDFNRWDERHSLMRPEQGGWWSVELPLAAGEYRFRYIADGNWFTDYASHGIEMSRFGWNSVLLVPRQSVAQAA